MVHKILNLENNAVMKNLRTFLFFLLFIIFPQNYSLSTPNDSFLEYAKSISLGIETPGSSGSGFLIGKKKDTYFFLTAAHVAFSDPLEEEYWAYSLGPNPQRDIESNHLLDQKILKILI